MKRDAFRRRKEVQTTLSFVFRHLARRFRGDANQFQLNIAKETCLLLAEMSPGFVWLTRQNR